MAEQSIQGPALFSTDTALEIQRHLGQRLQESKTKSTATEIEGAMGSLCADLLAYLGQWVKVGRRSVFGEGAVLYWVEQYWSDLAPLHAQYNSFHDFANQETREDYATWRCKINVFKTFIVNDRNDPMVAEYGAEAFLDVPLGKLQKAMGTVRKGEMSQEQWSALLDQNVSDKEFYAIMKARPGETPGDGENDIEESGGVRMTVSMQDGSLRWWPGGGQMVIKLGWLDVASKDELVKEAVDRLLDEAGIDRED